MCSIDGPPSLVSHSAGGVRLRRCALSVYSALHHPLCTLPCPTLPFPHPTRPYQRTLPYPTPSCPTAALPYPTEPYPIQLESILTSPTLPYRALPFPSLSYPRNPSYPARPCPSIPPSVPYSTPSPHHFGLPYSTTLHHDLSYPAHPILRHPTLASQHLPILPLTILPY